MSTHSCEVGHSATHSCGMAFVRGPAGAGIKFGPALEDAMSWIDGRARFTAGHRHTAPSGARSRQDAQLLKTDIFTRLLFLELR